MFTYSNERINTGNTAIDVIEDNLTTDILANEFLNEDGDKLLIEDGGSLMQEYRLETTHPSANNEYFSSNDPVFGGSSIIDFSETNPFSEVDRY